MDFAESWAPTLDTGVLVVAYSHAALDAQHTRDLSEKCIATTEDPQSIAEGTAKMLYKSLFRTTLNYV